MFGRMNPSLGWGGGEGGGAEVRVSACTRGLV